MRVSEPITKEEAAQFLKPSPWCLAKTIQGLIEFAHIRGSLNINESSRLLNVDIINKCALEKRIIYIKLLDWPTLSYKDSENSSNCGGLDNWTESVMEVNARALVKSLSNKSYFVTRNKIIRVTFDLINPFTSNNVL